MQNLIIVATNKMRTLPFSLIIRWVFSIGVSIRFITTIDVYELDRQLYILAATVIFIAYAATITRQIVQNSHISVSFYVAIIAADTIFSSLFIILSGLPESDLYLIYILPILIATEATSDSLRLRIIAGIILTFSSITLGLAFQFSISPSEAIIRNWLPRLTLLLIMSSIVFFQKREAQEREAYQAALLSIADNKDYSSRLNSIMSIARRILNADGCKVYMELPNQEALRLEALSGIPPNDKLYVGYILPISKGVAGQAYKINHYVIENNYSEYPERVSELEALFRSIVSVPLRIKGKVVGIISVFDNSGRRSFTREDVGKLQELSQYVAATVYDKILVQQQQEALDLLNLASKEINRNLDLIETAQSVSKYAYQVVAKHIQNPPLFTCLYLHRKTKNYLDLYSAFPLEYEESLRDSYSCLHLDDEIPGIIVRTFQSKSLQKSSDVASEKNYKVFSKETVSELSIPLLSSKGCIGVINIEYSDTYQFSDELIEMMQLFAQHATSAIDNAIYSQNQEDYWKKLTGLHTAVIKMGQTNHHTTLMVILEQLGTLIEYDRATLQRILPKEDIRLLLAHNGFENIAIDPKLHSKLSEDILVNELINKKVPIIIPDVGSDTRWTIHDATEDVMSWIGLPLIYQNDIIAIITVDITTKALSGDVSQQLLDLFSRHAAGILRNTELLDETKEKVAELEEKTTYLEIINNFLDEYRDLTLIGFVYGETIHYASTHLGAAKDDASQIPYMAVTDNVRKKADNIVEEIDSYLDVLDEFHRQAVTVPEPILLNVHSMLKNLIKMKQYRFERNKMLIIRNFWVDQLEVNGPEKQVKQVFLVIIENAINAMKPEGKLTFTTRPVEIDNHPYVEVSITDTGSGIPRLKRDNLFEFKNPGERRKTRRKGTGMGLPWARSFMRSYRGEVSYSTSKTGTTMKVLLPQDFKSLWALGKS